MKSKPNQKKKCKDLIRIIFTIKINLMTKYIFAILKFAFKGESVYVPLIYYAMKVFGFLQ